ncbi:MAG: hypothetical protein HKN19_07955, partial [Halioglobus sp.]|nr:hypothetical protein [Halioglobus sp.]
LYNFTAAAQALQAAGALRIVVNEQELLATLQTLFAAAGLRESTGEEGRLAAIRSRGALAHCLRRIATVLHQVPCRVE